MSITEALKSQLADALQDYSLPVGDSDQTRIPPVYRGAIPSNIDDAEAYPCLVVRWQGADDPDPFSGDAEENVVIIVCVSASEVETALAWVESFCLRLRTLLRSWRTLEKYERTGPVKAEVLTQPDDRRQGRNNLYHVAVLRTSWRWVWPELSPDQEAIYG